MIDDLLLGVGMVAIIEGLVLALAPGRLQDVLEFLSRMEPDRRRLLGLVAVALGVAVVSIARS